MFEQKQNDLSLPLTTATNSSITTEQDLFFQLFSKLPSTVDSNAKNIVYVIDSSLLKNSLKKTVKSKNNNKLSKLRTIVFKIIKEHLKNNKTKFERSKLEKYIKVTLGLKPNINKLIYDFNKQFKKNYDTEERLLCFDRISKSYIINNALINNII